MLPPPVFFKQRQDKRKAAKESGEEKKTEEPAKNWRSICLPARVAEAATPPCPRSYPLRLDWHALAAKQQGAHFANQINRTGHHDEAVCRSHCDSSPHRIESIRRGFGLGASSNRGGLQIIKGRAPRRVDRAQYDPLEQREENLAHFGGGLVFETAKERE